MADTSPRPDTDPAAPTAGPATDAAAHQRAQQLVYARRRVTVAGGLLAAVAAVALVWAPAVLRPEPTTVPQAAGPTDEQLPQLEARDASGRHPLDAAVDEAIEHYDATGTFVGAPIAAAHVATDRMLVVVGEFEGACWMAGHLDGAAVPALIDETGEACTPAALDQLRAEVEVADEHDAAAIDDELTAAAEGLVSWAALTTASFDGASWPGVEVDVSDDGHSARLTVTDTHRCRTTTVTLDGIISPVGDC